METVFFYERSKLMKRANRVLAILLALVYIMSGISAFADDNADTGNGDAESALSGKGFYRTSEYMYKVSVYVGLSDTADKNSVLERDWQMVGSSAIYVKPSTFTMPANAFYGSGSKVNYQSGSPLTAHASPMAVTDNPPPIPITHGGNIRLVKSYFGDTETLNFFIDAFASQKGTTRAGLVENLIFTIEGESKRYPANEILPVKVDDQYQNKVPWLIIYEPVVISHLKDRQTVLAFTATEYALAQKLGYFNFRGGSDGQYISGMTHSNLPNSIFLEESWFGFPVTSALPQNVYWNLDRVISGGGWGMRMLRTNGAGALENNTAYDHEYRVNTDVITSVRIYASDDITPDNRHTSEAAYNNPVINTATVTISANGYSKSTEIVLPSGSSELVWLKWRTPSTPQDVTVEVSVTGNSAARIDGTSRNATLTCRVVDLGLNPPPNPTAVDRNDDFRVPNMPVEAEKNSANWGIYSSTWSPKWVWHPKWEWNSSWSWISTGTGGFWVDNGYWVDNGKWVDEGSWQFNYTNYTASLTGQMSLTSDTKVPTARNSTMKSGYGVNINITTTPHTNAPSSHVTSAQNAISYFPEFDYETYWRKLQLTGYGQFQFVENKYSTYRSRVHFTPIWYPDETYRVYTEIIDMWTPEGMLRINLNEAVTIQGDLYQDWHIGPKK